MQKSYFKSLLGALALAILVPAAWAGNTGSTGISHRSNNGGGGPIGDAIRGGTAGTNQALASPASGFNCPTGEFWGFQDGVLKCVRPATSAVAALNGKVVYIRAKLINAFISGNILRLTGSNGDLRLDALDLNNQIVSTCFLNVAERACHLGLSGGANSNLAEDPRLPARNAQMWAIAGTARDFVTASLKYGGSRSGGALQDHYIVSAWTDASGLSVNVVGLYSGLTPGMEGTLTPVITTGSISLSHLSSSTNGQVFILSEAWAAPLY